MSAFVWKNESTREITREADPDDGWDRGNSRTSWFYSDTVQIVKRYSDFEIPEDLAVGDTLYIVYAVWSTADSFGSDEDSELTILYASTVFGKASFAHSLADKGYFEFPDGIILNYTPWGGYFETLSHISMHTVSVTE